jgi:DNA sulfur modification protein DndB
MSDIRIEAIKSRQGKRTMFSTRVDYRFLEDAMLEADARSERRSQRELDPAHARLIMNYITKNPDEYVLGSLCFALEGSYEFTPYKDDSDAGLLVIPEGSRVWSVDGQHRRQGFLNALEKVPVLSSDKISVVIYVEPDLEKRRQMFADMNATPKKVSKALSVGFNTRSPFAKAARLVIETHPLLKGRVDETKSSVPKSSEKWYTLGAVYDALRVLNSGVYGRMTDEDDYSEPEVTRLGKQFFDLLANSRDEYQEISDGKYKASELRDQSILLSGTTLRAIAGGVRQRLVQDGQTGQSLAERYSNGLRRIDFAKMQRWEHAGFVAPGSLTPASRLQNIAAGGDLVSEWMTEITR